jgi:hypothetical protein
MHGRPLVFPKPQRPKFFDLAGVADRIDWNADPEGLRRGDLSKLNAPIVLTIRLAVAEPDIIAPSLPGLTRQSIFL